MAQMRDHRDISDTVDGIQTVGHKFSTFLFLFLIFAAADI
jgi:hypothetical protein